MLLSGHTFPLHCSASCANLCKIIPCNHRRGCSLLRLIVTPGIRSTPCVEPRIYLRDFTAYTAVLQLSRTPDKTIQRRAILSATPFPIRFALNMSGAPPGAPPGGPPGAPPGAPLGPLPPNESRGHIINIVGWVGAAICTIFVLLRLYSRHYITRTLGWSDAIIVVAAILNIIATALASVAISYGIGKHVMYIPLENVTPTLFWGAVVRPISITSYCLPKLSVVILIISLMGTRKRGVWFLWTVIVILFITSALSFIMLFAQCNPPDHLWHPFEEADCYPDAVLDGITYLAGCEYTPVISREM